MEDYYKILGVDRNASKDDIKKAYKKLSLKWHPDKHSSEDESKKKEAEKMFMSINEANNILSDDNKRREYDMKLQYGENFSGFGFNPFANMHHHRQRVYPQGQTLNIPITLTIEDLYNYDKSKVISYQRMIRCNECGGEGGKNKKQCPHCNGTGVHQTISQRGNMTMISESPCVHCNGTGYTTDDIRQKCNGTGLTRVIEEFNLDEIPREYLLNEDAILNSPNRGSESRSPEMPNGDLNLIVKHDYDRSKYKVKTNGDIIQIVEVPYYDCVLGNKSFVFIGCDSGYHNVNIKSGAKQGEIFECKQMHGAIKGSKYYVEVKISIPNKISKEVKEKLEEIKQISEK